MDKYTLHIKIDDKSIVSLSIEPKYEIKFKEPLEKYLRLFNDKEYKVDNFTSMECTAYLCFYGPVELVTHTSEVYGFSQDLLYYKEDKEDGTEFQKPIIHLAISDVLSHNRKRYSKIIDSSIWNYFVQISRLETEELDYSYETLLFSVKNIINNYRSDLYKLSIALEYADFHARLLMSSNLSKSNGHGVYISPFLFHSESEHKESSIDKYVKNKEGDNYIYIDSSFAHKWRILLLDDHALKLMNYFESGNESERKLEEIIRRGQIIERNNYVDIIPDKLRIISNDIRSVFSNCKIGYVRADVDDKTIYDELTNKSVDKSCDIVFYCVSSVGKAKSVLEDRRFEIVLLDYLLGEKEDKSREYSYELLKKLKDIYIEDKKNPIFGPHRRLYFSFISAFTTAVNERLLAEGLHKSEKFWHIADGACPTNTPYLFLYNLLHLMNKRVEDMGIPKLSRINRQDFKEVSEGKVPYVKEYIIDEIFNDPNIRQKANDKFDDVLSLLYHYKKLLEDTHNTTNEFDSNRSVLATEFIKANPGLGGFLEHLTQLVYLIAFGTVRQWPEMWEEYQFISSIVGPQQNIEKYIMKLKSNNV